MTLVGSTSSSTTASAAGIGGTYGLSGSGIDVDSLVKKLMSGQQAVEDSLVQKQTVLQWQKSAYNTVYDDLNNFRTNTVFNYKLSATLQPNKASSGNSSVVTATAGSTAADVSHSLIVAQLAGGVNLTSSGTISATQPPTLGTLATQIYGAGNPDLPSAPFNITINNGSSSATIQIDPSQDSINDLISKINSAGVNVQATYDSTLDRFFLSTTNTGASAGISFSGDQAGMQLLGKYLKIPTVTSNGVTYSDNGTAKGTDAVFQLDGTSLSESTNSFTIAGVTYNLAGVSAGTLSTDVANHTFSGQAVSVSVSSDVDAAVANVQAFVDAYNKILTELNGDITQPRYTDYPPLTDAQKSSMSASDETLWNQKAQSGMLYNDSTLTSLVNTMRGSLSNPVSGVPAPYNSAASIGITTGDYTEGGLLHLDTDKLKAALQANPNVISQIFGSQGTTTTTNGVTTTNTSTQGIAGRLYDGINNTLNQLQQIAGTTASSSYDASSNLAVEISSYTDQINAAKDQFTAMQTQYYNQYNAMETAIQQISSQSSWLASMLGTSSSG